MQGHERREASSGRMWEAGSQKNSANVGRGSFREKRNGSLWSVNAIVANFSAVSDRVF